MVKRLSGEELDAWARELFGCSYQEALDLNDGRPLGKSMTAAMRFTSHKRGARTRGIGFEFTFPEWLKFWKDSGKWELRGQGHDSYCMARHGDIGPYSATNVDIETIGKNASDGQKNLRANGPVTKTFGKGKGWYFNPKPGVKKPYVASVASKRLGSFATQGEAEAAYSGAVHEILESFERKRLTSCQPSVETPSKSDACKFQICKRRNFQ